MLQKQNFKLLGNYTRMQCGTSHLQTVQENILSHIILATYRKFTVATVWFTQNVSCNIYTHPIYQQSLDLVHGRFGRHFEKNPCSEIGLVGIISVSFKWKVAGSWDSVGLSDIPVSGKVEWDYVN